ncbi:uncharacterized protein [Palaemon carinicauda]|uniref:uncharacterized protein n=1 Tax=Palaemon carinicauda TaxID=392227 RepID=UPI0035B64DD5
MWCKACHAPVQAIEQLLTYSRKDLASLSALFMHMSKLFFPFKYLSTKLNHKFERCHKFLALDGQQIRELGVCFKCLNRGHTSKNCKVRCAKCQGGHNELICGIKLNVAPQANVENGDRVAPASASMLSGHYSNKTLLQTAKVKVMNNKGGFGTAKLLFDSGYDRSYDSSKFTEICKPEWVTRTEAPYSSFGGHSSGKDIESNVYKLNVLDKKGLDYYWSLMNPKHAVQVGETVAMSSVFGWVSSGNVGNGCNFTQVVGESSLSDFVSSSPLLLSISGLSDADVVFLGFRNYWHYYNYSECEADQDLRDMYVDNWFSGADTVEKVATKFKTAYDIMADANMSLEKVSSNSVVIASKFKEKRVREIQHLTPPSHWHHCRGSNNQADLMTKGLLAEKLVGNNLWFSGLCNLSDPTFSIQDGDNSIIVDETVNYELEDHLVCLSVQTATPMFDVEKYTDLKSIRIVGYVQRFISNCKEKGLVVAVNTGGFTTEELDKDKARLIYVVQREAFPNEIKALSDQRLIPRNSKLRKLDPFIDDKGIVRIKGRLQFSDLSYESKHPVILPKGHFSKLLLQFQHKFLKHSGVNSIVSSLRSSFHVTGVRGMAKTVVRECLQ